MSVTREKKQKLNDRVFVTGMGILSSTGQGLPSFRNALLNGYRSFNKSNLYPDLSFPLIAAELNNFHFEKTLSQFLLPSFLLEHAYKVGRRAPLTIQASLIASLEAWQQANLHQRLIDKTRIGLVIAGQNTTQAYQYSLHKQYKDDLSYLPPTYALQFMDTDHVGTLSEVLDIQGEGLCVGGASASGNVGIIQGYRLIRQGLVDTCLVIGALADLSPMELQAFYNIGALGGQSFHDEPLRACRPFDRDHEGFIPGQASGALVLESQALVERSGINKLGEIIGTAMLLDGHRSSDPSLSGEIRAMQQALNYAKLKPKDISYLNTHGSSSALGDEVEISAIKDVFEGTLHQIWLNSTKSILGHCLWSAGVVEAIATLLQLQENFLHPNFNLESPINKVCRFVGPRIERTDLHNVMSNSFGFGGINTSLIFNKGI